VPEVGVYQKSGEMDIYEGNASQTTLRFSPSFTALSQPITWDSFVSMFEDSRVELRFGINSVLVGSKYRAFNKIGGKVKNLIPKPGKWGYAGFVVSGYVDLRFTMPKEYLRQLVSLIVQAYTSDHSTTHIEFKAKIQEVYEYMFALFRFEKPAGEIPRLFREALDLTKNDEAVVHTEFGIGGYGEFKAALGAKARLRASLFAGGVYRITARRALAVLFEEAKESHLLKDLLAPPQKAIDAYVDQ
jgi:hypothetical protein